MSDLVLPDESYAIMGACFEVYKEMGCGFLEAVYQECLEYEFADRKIPFISKPPLRLQFKNRQLKTFYQPDFICIDQIVIEIKAVSTLADEHSAQVLNYLNATKNAPWHTRKLWTSPQSAVQANRSNQLKSLGPAFAPFRVFRGQLRMSDYTTVIGLEVHVQLATESKLFCRCSTKFGAEPNTQTCPVCIGLPGSLPVMNRAAYELALKTAVAINCDIPEFTKWDRKQYYYPDLPKGYQISQFDLPMSDDGYLEISDPKGRFEPKRVGIIRAHLEEDAGKSVHDEAAGKADSEIDLNRTGTPLLEIVSQPDMRSSAEARVFLQELKLLLTYLGVSDCNMQEGSLRVDANVNLHIDHGPERIATPIVEIKNMNSFRAVERALDYEAPRLYREWQETGRKLGDAPKQTRGWDDVAGVTRAQRSKEESSDYRYFPDPDLTPVVLTASAVNEVRETLGELPAALRSRLSADYQLSAYDADVLVNQGRAVVDYFLAVADATADPKSACNWVTQQVLRELKERDQSIDQFAIPAPALAGLITAINDGRLPSTRATEAFQLMLAKGCNVESALTELKIERVDESALIALVQDLLAANPKTVADIRAGKLQAAGSLIGQAKKQNPNVDPNRVRELAIELAGKDDA